LSVVTSTSGPLGVALYGACDAVAFIDCFDPSQGPIVLNGLQAETTYYVRIWNSGGDQAGTFTVCDETDSPQAVGEEAARSSMRVWPVPAEGQMSVEGLAEGTTQLRLLDAQGREVMRQRVNGPGVHVMNTASLASGAYVLRAEGRTPQVMRVVVQ
jgi:hypothetical protein